jgi:hypothetical protein
LKPKAEIERILNTGHNAYIIYARNSISYIISLSFFDLRSFGKTGAKIKYFQRSKPDPSDWLLAVFRILYMQYAELLRKSRFCVSGTTLEIRCEEAQDAIDMYHSRHRMAASLRQIIAAFGIDLRSPHFKIRILCVEEGRTKFMMPDVEAKEIAGMLACDKQFSNLLGEHPNLYDAIDYVLRAPDPMSLTQMDTHVCWARNGQGNPVWQPHRYRGHNWIKNWFNLGRLSTLTKELERKGDVHDFAYLWIGNDNQMRSYKFDFHLLPKLDGINDFRLGKMVQCEVIKDIRDAEGHFIDFPPGYINEWAGIERANMRGDRH